MNPTSYKMWVNPLLCVKSEISYGSFTFFLSARFLRIMCRSPFILEERLFTGKTLYNSLCYCLGFVSFNPLEQNASSS